MPAWLPNIPHPAKAALPRTLESGASAVYFNACVNRIFGSSRGEHPEMTLAEAMVTLSLRAGMPLWIPEDIGGNCCATVWHSKGYVEGNTYMANHVVESMWRWSNEGRIPVVCDASSCTFGITTEILNYLTPENMEKHRRMTLLDSIAWAHDYLLPHLEIKRKVGSSVIHAVCATHHLNLADKLLALAQAVSETALSPIYSTCCAFAGDRGFLHPELTKTATLEEVAELGDQTFDQYISSNRTCEIGMNLATGQDYRSIIFLLEEATRS
jgi:D-lactate dehydrogenase